MPIPKWQKPENALCRANGAGLNINDQNMQHIPISSKLNALPNELLELNKKQDALETLHDVIMARKHRHWTKIHELIIIKHLELCVELRKPHLAKDGLFQYRNMCQQVNVKSLENVIETFLEMAEKKADQAREESHGMVEDMEDLDLAESPEKLLLSAVSGEGPQCHADQAVLRPWLRFLWESYWQCLELLTNNIRVETLYHKVAKQCFQFCLNYQRKPEFRKLCDNLRTNLNQIQKMQHTLYATTLENPETLAMHQKTHVIQLDVAIQMKLWQEAFKSAEDVHSLMQLSECQAKPSALASYYKRLALIFWKAGNTLYHAAAVMKLLQLTKEFKKSVSVNEATHLATRALLATVSIQSMGATGDLSKQLEMEDQQQENQCRLASLLFMPSPPNRSSLMKDAIRLNVNNMAIPTAQRLHQMLELKFDPLNLGLEIDKHLNSLKEIGKAEYVQYIVSLKQVSALKILKQVSQVYQSVTFQFLAKIIPFFDVSQIESLVIGAQMQVWVNHRTDSVDFGVSEGLNFGGEEEAVSNILMSTHPNVPVIQIMTKEQIFQHLQQMYAVLQDAVEQVDIDINKHLIEQIQNEITFYGYFHADLHKRNLERKKRIEAYKEVTERARSEQEHCRLEVERILSEQKARITEERIKVEKEQRYQQMQLRKQKEIENKFMKDRVERLKDPILKKFMENLPTEKIENLDPDRVIELQISHLSQEKRKHTTKLIEHERKQYYLVRMIHMEEIPLREEEYNIWVAEDVTLWDEYETQRCANAIEEHEYNVDAYHRFKRMEVDGDEFVATCRQARVGEFQQRVAEWKKRVADVRKKRLAERKEERKNKRREAWQQVYAFHRLKRVKVDGNKIVTTVRQARRVKFQQQVDEWENRMEGGPKKCLAERKEERKNKRHEWQQIVAYHSNEIVATVRQARVGEFQQCVAEWEKYIEGVHKKRYTECKEERKNKRRELLQGTYVSTILSKCVNNLETLHLYDSLTASTTSLELEKSKKLRNFDLTFGMIGDIDSSVEYTADDLLNVLVKCTNLTEIQLECYNVKLVTDDFLRRLIEECPLLEKLSLSIKYCRSKEIVAKIADLENLMSLAIESCDNGSVLNELCCKLHKLNNLSNLTVTGCIGETGLLALKNVKSLTSFSYRGHLSPKMVQNWVATGFLKKLTCLSFSYATITHSMVKSIIENVPLLNDFSYNGEIKNKTLPLIAENCKHLQMLDLSGCSGVSEKRVFDFLSKSNSLQSLRLIVKASLCHRILKSVKFQPYKHLIHFD